MKKKTYMETAVSWLLKIIIDVISYVLRKKPKAIVVPRLGVGLAQLPTRAPKCFEFLEETIYNIKFFVEHSSLVRW